MVNIRNNSCFARNVNIYGTSKVSFGPIGSLQKENKLLISKYIHSVKTNIFPPLRFSENIQSLGLQIHRLSSRNLSLTEKTLDFHTVNSILLQSAHCAKIRKEDVLSRIWKNVQLAIFPLINVLQKSGSLYKKVSKTHLQSSYFFVTSTVGTIGALCMYTQWAIM